MLSQKEKKKLEAKILNDGSDVEKEKVRQIVLRVPYSYFEDIQKLMKKTSSPTMNAVCVDIIRFGIKEMKKRA